MALPQAGTAAVLSAGMFRRRRPPAHRREKLLQAESQWSIFDTASSVESHSLDEPAADVLRLEVGTCLGPYEIVASIDRGGMGEVYQAVDRRLDRQVAVKVPPTRHIE